MKTTTHTPGPWRVGLTTNKGDVWKGWRETDINGPEGCFLSLSQYHLAEEADANARLIAAAPEMLAALRALWSEEPGRAGLMAYYHDAASCEAPGVCAHCIARDAARTLLARIDGSEG